MTQTATLSGQPTSRGDRAVGIWLLIIAALIGLMVLVGGLTRLTGSGLSITEWQPVTGALPPMSEGDWQAEFAKYKGTPQYELINKGMGLAGFKQIYWWEWTHRLLGRLIGVVLAIPFFFFLWRKRIDKKLAWRLAGIFVLGGAQGVLGWWMVQSGLEPSRVAVSQYRLAAHLGLAIILFGFVLWTAFEVLAIRRTANLALAARFRTWAAVLCVLIFIQMILGAFMSGTNAGLAFSTWPDYAGAFIPPGLYDLAPWWINHFENPALIQFQHRTLAYVVVLLAAYLFVAMNAADKPLLLPLFHVMAITLLQVMLGILVITNFVPVPLAAAHQIVALFLFAASVWLLFALGAKSENEINASR